MNYKLLLSLVSFVLLVSSVQAVTWTSAGGCWTASNGANALVMWNATGCTVWTDPAAASSVWYFVVAGGGNGGGYNGPGGGGGAGGVLNGTQALTPGNIYNVCIGAGGNGKRATYAGLSGFNSSFANTTAGDGINAQGGGGGGGYSDAPATGGSGGGRGSDSTAKAGGAGIAGQGNNGGASVSGGSYASGGGGGAGSVGITALVNISGGGGSGISSSITGTATIYAGGGGGTQTQQGSVYGVGGSGGGGDGSHTYNGVGNAGTNGLGGGGGGSHTGNGGAGGSGVIIISYLNIPPTTSFNIQLIDTSTNTPTSWQWNATNLLAVTPITTTISTSQNPIVSLGQGNWLVELISTNSAGSSTNKYNRTLGINLTSPVVHFWNRTS
jgi:hypothetical protein